MSVLVGEPLRVRIDVASADSSNHAPPCSRVPLSCPPPEYPPLPFRLRAHGDESVPRTAGCISYTRLVVSLGPVQPRDVPADRPAVDIQSRLVIGTHVCTRALGSERSLSSMRSISSIERPASSGPFESPAGPGAKPPARPLPLRSHETRQGLQLPLSRDALTDEHAAARRSSKTSACVTVPVT